MYRHEYNRKIRSFDIKNNNDYGLFLQVVKFSCNAMGLNECLGQYRIRSASISRKKTGKVKPYFQLMHDNLHFPYVLCCWFLFTNVAVGKLWKYESKNQ